MRSMLFSAAAAAALAIAVPASADVFSDYEDLAEGFHGETLVHNGVTYRDINRVSGSFPDGDTFGENDLGSTIMVERAVPLYDDFPDFGSPVNGLTFGSAYIPGDNLSIGALGSVWMDLDELSNAASVEIAHYENGPWIGIEFRLDALRNGVVVNSTSYAIGGTDPSDRDSPAVAMLSLAGAEFDQLHLYGWFNDGYSGPRGLIDNLTITAVPEPASLGALAAGGLLALRRRRR